MMGVAYTLCVYGFGWFGGFAPYFGTCIWLCGIRTAGELLFCNSPKE
jgi:hypothetical protein